MSGNKLQPQDGASRLNSLLIYEMFRHKRHSEPGRGGGRGSPRLLEPWSAAT